MSKKTRILSFVVILAASLFALGIHSGKVHAGIGRPINVGYFDGNTCNSTGNAVLEYNNVTAIPISGGQTSAQVKAEFTLYVIGYLQNPGMQQYQRTGAAFIIHTMLGDPAGSSKNITPSDITRWENVINQSDVTASVQNFAYKLNTRSQGCGFDDDAQYNSSATAVSVVFTQGGSNYAIKETCGNPVGNLTPLKPQKDQKPSIGVTTPACGDTTFQVTSSDPDGGSYSIYWRTEWSNNGGSTWTPAPNTQPPGNGWNSASGFPGSGISINLPAFPSATYPAMRTMRLQVETRGYDLTGGSGTLVPANSNNWGSCGASNPTGKLIADCSSATIQNAVDNDSKNSTLTVRLYWTITGQPAPGTAISPDKVANQGGGHDSTPWNISSLANYSPHTYYAYAFDIPSHNLVLIASKPVGQCKFPTCTFSSSPAVIEENSAFTVTVGADYSANTSGSPPTGVSISLTAPAGSTLQPGSPVINDKYTQSTYSFTGLPIGLATFKWNFSSSFGNLSCSKPIQIVALPYLQAYGGDIFAGGGFGSGCTTAAGDGSITTFANGDLGSGSQFAAFAMSVINSNPGSRQGFSSAQDSVFAAGSYPNPPSGLSFANKTSPLGNFSGSNCVTGQDLPSPMPTSNVSSPITSWPNSDKVWYYTETGGTPLTINAPGSNVPIGHSFRLYVSGDVIIKSDIQYANSNSWGSADDVPSLTIVASGNISIAQGVNNLDGTYVAHNTINTCTTALGAPIPAIQLYSSCGGAGGSTSQLVVHGQLVAGNIEWSRTYQTLGAAAANENPYNGSLPNAAELIIDGPENYICSKCAISNQQYNAYTSLPPIL